MRQIKFRAWEPQNNRMIMNPYRFEPTPAYVLESPEVDSWRRMPFICYEDIGDVEDGIVRPCEIMQFTGLQDKNGKDIYEGDIVKRHFDFYTDPADFGGRRHVKQDRIFTIEWGTWCWVKKERPDWNGSSFDPVYARECEVIGNIYESPELLTPVI